MSIDPVKWRFLRIHWGWWICALALPAVTWLVARNALELKATDAMFLADVSLAASLIILALRDRYLQRQFFDRYIDKNSWQYLQSNYRVDRRPPNMPIEWKGHGQLGDETVQFVVEAAADADNLYLNVQALDRLLIPWKDIAYLRRVRVPTNSGWEHRAELMLHTRQVQLTVSWPREAEAIVPASVGIGT